MARDLPFPEVSATMIMCQLPEAKEDSVPIYKQNKKFNPGCISFYPGWAGRRPHCGFLLSFFLKIQIQMKTNILIIALALPFFLIAQQEEPEYVMLHNVFLTPKGDKVPEFRENLAAHNKRFHSGGPFHVNIWQVVSGPEMGKYVNSMGPQTFEDIDNRTRQEGHDEDWVTNVMPLIEEIEDGGYWKIAPAQSYALEDAQPTKLLIRVFDIQEGKFHRVNALMEEFAKAYAAEKANISRVMYNRVGWTNDGREKALVFGLNSWSELDRHNPAAIYTEVHGETAWDNFLDEMETVMVSGFDTLWQLSPELSGDAEN